MAVSIHGMRFSQVTASQCEETLAKPEDKVVLSKGTGSFELALTALSSAPVSSRVWCRRAGGGARSGGGQPA